MMSIGDALSAVLKNAKWKSRLDEIRIKEEWSTIMGATIAKYTHAITFNNGLLTIYTNVAPLKHELKTNATQIVQNINDHFGESVVREVLIK